MLRDKQEKALTDLYDTARKNEILEPKTTLLIPLATAMAMGCQPEWTITLARPRNKG
jgi:hypothetical protein